MVRKRGVGHRWDDEWACGCGGVTWGLDQAAACNARTVRPAVRGVMVAHPPPAFFLLRVPSLDEFCRSVFAGDDRLDERQVVAKTGETARALQCVGSGPTIREIRRAAAVGGTAVSDTMLLVPEDVE